MGIFRFLLQSLVAHTNNQKLNWNRKASGTLALAQAYTYTHLKFDLWPHTLSPFTFIFLSPVALVRWKVRVCSLSLSVFVSLVDWGGHWPRVTGLKDMSKSNTKRNIECPDTSYFAGQVDRDAFSLSPFVLGRYVLALPRHLCPMDLAKKMRCSSDWASSSFVLLMLLKNYCQNVFWSKWCSFCSI